jgi:hypothetical protein
LTDDNNPTGYAQPIEAWTVALSNRTGSSTPVMTYLIGDHVFGQIASGATSPTYYVIDGHGSTRATVSSTGSVTATLNYDNAGDPDGFTPSASTPIYSFGGDALFDYVSATYLNGDGDRVRTGYRFIQMDSIHVNPGDLQNADLYLYADANSVSGWDPTGHDFDLLSLTIAVGISATLTGIVGGISSSVLGGSFYEGFSRGFISGAVSSALIIGTEGAFPPSVAFGLSNAIGDIVLDAYEGKYAFPAERNLAILKTIGDAAIGLVGGAWFSANFPEAAATDSASLLQVLRFSLDGATVRTAAQQIGVILATTTLTGFGPAVLDQLIDLLQRGIADAANLFKTQVANLGS